MALTGQRRLGLRAGAVTAAVAATLFAGLAGPATAGATPAAPAPAGSAACGLKPLMGVPPLHPPHEASTHPAACLARASHAGP